MDLSLSVGAPNPCGTLDTLAGFELLIDLKEVLNF
jgi:hypothetical protein